MDTRDRLIESTKELLWERGYVGISPKAIQSRSKAGQGSMYHHFSGKSDLALEAIRRTAEQIRARAEANFSSGGSACEVISTFLLREREVLRGCPLGRLTQDPAIMASPVLRQPLAETFAWLQKRLAEIIAQGQVRGEFDPEYKAEEVAAAIAATVQGGYVLSKAAGSEEVFHLAIKGLLTLLASRTRKASRPRRRT